MKNLKFILIIIIISMGLFGFFNKKKQEEKTQKPLLGMVLLKEAGEMNMQEIISELKNKWKLKIGHLEKGEEASVMEIDGYQVAIFLVTSPVPGDEIRTTAQYNYLWADAETEATTHQAHIIFSIVNAGKKPVAENILFTKIASAILKHTNSLGIYIGERTLLLKKDFYIDNAEMMTEQDLPLFNWIYFGWRQDGDKNSIYTYGLKDFGKLEMEIIDSKHSMMELQNLMFDIAHYVILSDVVLNDGETIGMSESQKLKIRKSKGKFLEGETLKIEY